jgi:hypothetical protein
MIDRLANVLEDVIGDAGHLTAEAIERGRAGVQP